jgi:hypothetical protein
MASQACTCGLAWGRPYRGRARRQAGPGCHGRRRGCRLWVRRRQGALCCHLQVAMSGFCMCVRTCHRTTAATIKCFDNAAQVAAPAAAWCTTPRNAARQRHAARPPTPHAAPAAPGQPLEPLCRRLASHSVTTGHSPESVCSSATRLHAWASMHKLADGVVDRHCHYRRVRGQGFARSTWTLMRSTASCEFSGVPCTMGHRMSRTSTIRYAGRFNAAHLLACLAPGSDARVVAQMLQAAPSADVDKCHGAALSCLDLFHQKDSTCP